MLSSGGHDESNRRARTSDREERRLHCIPILDLNGTRLTAYNRKYSTGAHGGLSTIYVISNKIIKTISFCYCHCLWN